MCNFLVIFYAHIIHQLFFNFRKICITFRNYYTSFMRYPIILLLAFLVITAHSCKKSSGSSPKNNNNNNNTTVSPYYFKFSLNGISHNFTDSTPQYQSFYSNLAGGYEDTLDWVFFPSAGLSFTWHTGDTVKESDIMGLKGKILYFNDTNITPQLSYDKDNSSTTLYSTDTSNKTYNVSITNVTFLKADTSLGIPLRTYVITGTCTAVMSDGTTTSLLTSGSFNFIICRQNY